MEGVDVAHQVELGGEGPLAALPGTLQHHPHVGVHSLVLVHFPRVTEHLVAQVTRVNPPVRLPSVLQKLRPGLPCEHARLFPTGVPVVYLFMASLFTGAGEAHLTAFEGALVGRQQSVLLAHVQLQLLVLFENLPATRHVAAVFLLIRGVFALKVSQHVGVGGERVRTAVGGAWERLRPAVGQLVPREVVGAGERLTTAAVLTREGFDSRVFAEVGIEFPLFVVPRVAVGIRTNVSSLWYSLSFHPIHGFA